MKKYLHRATKYTLKNPDQSYLISGLHKDKELVFHIDMTPSLLPELIINNVPVAIELLICMTNTAEITKYYDVLTNMKMSVPLLEVFNGVSNEVQFPKNYIILFL